MELSPAPYRLATLPSAFAAACRDSRSDAELFERCRDALVRRFHSDQIWFVIGGQGGIVSNIGTAEGRSRAIEVSRIKSGETEVVIWAEPGVAQEMRGVATPLALGLSVVLELRTVLLERQASLDDATFQLRALRQVTRLLSSVHSTEETEQLVMDFIAEVFFAWWACLYRPDKDEYVPRTYRALNEDGKPMPLNRARMDQAFPVGSGVVRTDDISLASQVDPRTKVLISLEAGTERLAVLALGARISGKNYGVAEFELAGTLSFAAAIALKNALLVEQLHSAATTDGLTGLYNRRAVEQRLEAEISRATRHQLTTTIVLLDLDRFKQVNDSLGHAGGDRLLVLVADILRQQCRTLDAVGRLGGDEFLVILPMTSPEEAMVFVGRVLSDIRNLETAHPEFGRQSVSLGIAAAPRHGATLNALMASADVALYKAKNSGRNAVAHARGPVITLAAAQPFIILGDAIWIDFVNTARGTGPVADRLVDHAAYLQWTRLEKLPPDDPPVPFTDILEFRDRLTGLARAVSAGKQAPASAIHAINAILAQGSGYHQLTRVQGSWRTVFTPVRAATALDAVARSAALTLSDPEAVIRQCSGPQCTLYFIDSSPNHSRRWCSGATCGKQLRVERRRTAR